MRLGGDSRSFSEGHSLSDSSASLSARPLAVKELGGYVVADRTAKAPVGIEGKRLTIGGS